MGTNDIASRYMRARLIKQQQKKAEEVTKKFAPGMKAPSFAVQSVLRGAKKTADGRITLSKVEEARAGEIKTVKDLEQASKFSQNRLRTSLGERTEAYMNEEEMLHNYLEKHNLQVNSLVKSSIKGEFELEMRTGKSSNGKVITTEKTIEGKIAAMKRGEYLNIIDILRLAMKYKIGLLEGKIVMEEEEKELFMMVNESDAEPTLRLFVESIQ